MKKITSKLKGRLSKSLSAKGSPILKAIIFALALLLVMGQGYSFLSIVFLIILSLFFYLRPLFKTTSLLASFVGFIVLSLSVSNKFVVLSSNPRAVLSISMIAFALLFGFLFYLLLGIKNLKFAKRRELYYFFLLSLLYLAFILFFTADRAGSLLFESFLLFVFYLSLLREFFYIQEHRRSFALKLITLVLGLIMLEIIWVIGLLPIGFSSAASLATVIAFAFFELTHQYLKNGLSSKIVKSQTLGLMVVTGAIFLLAQWTI